MPEPAPKPQPKPELMPADWWRRHAACRGVDPDIFYPGRGRHDTSRQARKVCRGCPEAVRVACLDYSLARNEQGVWGGRTEDQRLKMRRLPRAAICLGCGHIYMRDTNRQVVCRDCAT